MDYYSVTSRPPDIENLHSKREDLNLRIRQEEEEKEKLQHDIRKLSEKLSRVNDSLGQRLAARANLDRTIAETEAAYTKVRVPAYRHTNRVRTLRWRSGFLVLVLLLLALDRMMLISS